MNARTRLYASIAGTILVALCCFTPILVITLTAVGLAAFTPYLDIVLFPLLGVFVVVPWISELCRERRMRWRKPVEISAQRRRHIVDGGRWRTRSGGG